MDESSKSVDFPPGYVYVFWIDTQHKFTLYSPSSIFPLVPAFFLTSTVPVQSKSLDAGSFLLLNKFSFSKVSNPHMDDSLYTLP